MTQSGLLVKETNYLLKYETHCKSKGSSPFICSSQFFLVIGTYQVSPGVINHILNYHA